MNRVYVAVAATLIVGAAVGRPVPGWSSVPSSQRLTQAGRYLMADRQAEIALARSAAPAAISLHATILVLTVHGYDTAEKGRNGFTCLVERSWESPFDDSGFWNWRMRGPVCYNPSASRSVLPYTLARTHMALSGDTAAQMLDALRSAIADRRLPELEAGSMAYMMSKDQYLNDAAKAWYPHVMLYAPKANGADAGASWGADRHGSPVLYDSSHQVVPEPWAIFYVPVAHWSDGSAGPK